jgi:ABC-type multidrug transport system fused ATPase/permease subunit
VLIFIIFVFVLKTLFLSFLYKFQSKFANEFLFDLSVKLFAGYLRQPYHFHVNTNSANLIKNIQGNISNLSNVTQAGINLLVEVSIIFGVISLIIISTPIGGVVIISCLFVLVYLFNEANKKKLTFWGERKQILGGILLKDLQESFGGVKDLIILNKQEYFINKYKKNYKEFSIILSSINILNLLPRLYLELFAILSLAGLVLILNYFGDPATVIPTLGLFVAGAFRMIPSANRIISSMQTVRYSSPAIDVLYEEFVMIKNNIYSNIINNNIANFKNTLFGSLELSILEHIIIKSFIFQPPEKLLRVPLSFEIFITLKRATRFTF